MEYVTAEQLAGFSKYKVPARPGEKAEGGGGLAVGRGGRLGAWRRVRGV